MRVISGKYKGRKLSSFEGDAVRPTSDRAKEGVFSVLQFELIGKSFYDGFCGSGAMGIEALSRGASKAVFTDSSVKSCNLTKKNLQMVGENSKVINMDCLNFLSTTSDKFDIIFLDPPYKLNCLQKALEIISSRNILNENGLVVTESESAVNQPIQGLFLEKSKKYGIAQFSFYRKTNNKIAVFAGSFDPVTKGHVHIVEKGLERFEKIIVALGNNENKKYTFSKSARLEMLERAYEHLPNVSVTFFDGYLVDFLKENKTVNNLRGIRNEQDLKYEEDMLEVNKKLYPEINNVYIYADSDMKEISSTAFKQAYKEDKNWRDYIPENCLKVLLSEL